MSLQCNEKARTANGWKCLPQNLHKWPFQLHPLGPTELWDHCTGPQLGVGGRSGDWLDKGKACTHSLCFCACRDEPFELSIRTAWLLLIVYWTSAEGHEISISSPLSFLCPEEGIPEQRVHRVCCSGRSFHRVFQFVFLQTLVNTNAS